MVKFFQRVRVGFFVLLTAFSASVFAGVAEDVKAVVEENMAATQSEDMDRMMNTIHRQSPSYKATRQQVAPLFQQYDLTYELNDYEFVGMTGEFAVVKVRQTTRKVGGEAAFNNNELELLQAFKKEGGQWKFWSQSILN
ncbi:hypothetical protein ABMA58_19960, partial [Oceanospirillum sp. HFRX-1_2]